jgi:hypothetical protein
LPYEGAHWVIRIIPEDFTIYGRKDRASRLPDAPEDRFLYVQSARQMV